MGDYLDSEASTVTFRRMRHRMERFVNGLEEHGQTTVRLPRLDMIARSHRQQPSVRSVLVLVPGVDQFPKESFREIVKKARLEAGSVRARMRTRVVYYGANGLGNNYDIRRWALMDGSNMGDIAGGLGELFWLFPNAHFYVVAHSWGAAATLYFLRELCSDDMRLRMFMIPIAGVCWLPEGTDTMGLADFLSGGSFYRIKIVPIFSHRDGVVPEVVACPPGIRGHSVPVGGKKRDVHNRILKEEATGNRGWYAIFGDVDERTSLVRSRERRRLHGMRGA
jgi:hypothetical protein